MADNIEESDDVIIEENVSGNLELELSHHAQKCFELLNIPPSELPPVRCFATSSGQVFVGIPFVETSDSFLVGVPVRLIMGEDRKITTEPISTESVIRYFKNSIRYITSASDRSLYYYYTFLIQNGIMYLPDVVTYEMIALLVDRVNEIRLNSPDELYLDRSVESLDIKTEGASKDSFAAIYKSEKIH